MKITVYLGTGGVGKTSVAAATALAMARAGEKVLVLTIDPAQRLRTALRLGEGVLEHKVQLDPPASGELWAALLDVRATLDEAVRLYAKKDLVERILNHPIYAIIADSLAGMQELMAVERLDQIAKRRFVDHVIVDTAPSRHALEFLDKPMYFADLVGSGWVKLVGRTYKFVAKTRMMSLGSKSLELYARVEEILGASLVRQILDFYSIFVATAEGYADRASHTVKLLKNPGITDFRVVTTPQKALRDARFFHDALAARKFPLGGIYVNRVWTHAADPTRLDGMARQVVEWYQGVHESHEEAVRVLSRDFSNTVPRITTLGELERDVDGLAALEKIAAQMA